MTSELQIPQGLWPRLVAVALLALVLPLQYVAISNASELYSYPGDDTGIWQRGCLLPWASLPFRPFIGNIFRVVRQPFWPCPGRC